MSAEPHVFELLPAYVFGSLDEAERLAVSDHVSGCLVCTTELNAYQMLTDQLALAAPPVTPSPQVKHRLMARVTSSPSTQPNLVTPPRWRQRPEFAWRVALTWSVVSFLLILVLAASNLLLWQRLTRLETVSRSGMRAIPLLSTSLAPGAAGFVIIGADGQNGAFVVDALPTLEPSYQYQLWLLENEQKTSGAVFTVDENGYGGGRIRASKNLHQYSACDVSIEPAGGSSWPTGERVLGGSLK
jgi:anti-sigma-K factor RskA